MTLRLEGSSSLLDKFLVQKVADNRPLLKIVCVAYLEGFALWRMDSEPVVEEVRSSVAVNHAMRLDQQGKAGELGRGESTVEQLFYVMLSVIWLGVAAGRERW